MDKLKELIILEGQLNEKRYEVIMEQMKAIEETQKTILLVLSTMIKEPQIKNAIREVVDYDPIKEAKKIAEREVAAESKPYGDEILKPENRNDYISWLNSLIDQDDNIQTESPDGDIQYASADDKITIRFRKEQGFIDFTEWLYRDFREYYSTTLRAIFDKIGFGDALVDHELEVTDGMVYLFSDDLKVVIYTNK